MQDSDEREVCPKCGNSYKCLPNHWIQNSRCDFPDIEPEKIELLKDPPDGIWVTRDGGSGTNRNSKLVIQANTGRYSELCKFVNNLGWLMNRHHVYGMVGDGGFVHRTTTKTHPQFNEWK